jgi:hypothetical protein
VLPSSLSILVVSSYLFSRSKEFVFQYGNVIIIQARCVSTDTLPVFRIRFTGFTLRITVAFPIYLSVTLRAMIVSIVVILHELGSTIATAAELILDILLYLLDSMLKTERFDRYSVLILVLDRLLRRLHRHLLALDRLDYPNDFGVAVSLLARHLIHVTERDELIDVLYSTPS